LKAVIGFRFIYGFVVRRSYEVLFPVVMATAGKLCLLAQCKIKGSAMPRHTFRPDIAVMPEDYPLGSGKPDPVTGEIFPAMEAMKWNEELVGLGHVETWPIVPHVIGR